MSTIIKYGSSGAWLNYNGKVLNANATTIPPLTYRFRFESAQTAADLAGVGQNGTWNRVSDYVWDFTCDPEHDPWYRNFYYGWHGNGLLPDCHLVGASTTSSDDLWETFNGQTNLKSAYIPVAKLTSAFDGCTSLASLQMDNFAGGDSQLRLPYTENIDFGVFNGREIQATNCKSLHIGNLPGTDYSNQNFTYVGSSRSAQDPCTIVIDSMSAVEDISTMFQGNNGVGTVYLGNTSSLTKCTNTFASCGSLRQVHIDDMSNVTSTRQMFSGCELLPSCPAFDLSSCTDMAFMFYDCEYLTACPDFTVDNGVLSLAGYEAVKNMYSGCTRLEGGAFDWYYKLTGDTNAYINAYGRLPPDPYYQGPFTHESDTNTFEYANSDEVGWPYISSYWK